ncbi:MAG: hypothetical protein JWQ98_3445 [Chlorobi bacterium]|nr:hypothetical protein [Chlorobiota bacterium]
MRLVTFIGLLLQLALLFRSDELFLSRPFQEDSFYVMSVARSLARGTGLSVDGVHPTNGVQPLICFLDAPLFALSNGNDFLALRLALFLQIIIMGCAVFAIARFVTTLLNDEHERRRVFWLVAMILAWSYTIVNGLLNGLETGLAVTITFVTLAYYNSGVADPLGPGTPPFRNYLILGALLGIAVLTRIDIAILVPMILLVHLIQAHLRFRSLPMNERLRAARRVFTGCVVVGAMSLAISSPWWVYNVTRFGSLVPISGQSQRMLLPNWRTNLSATALALSDAVAVSYNTPRTLAERFPAIGTILLLVVLAGGLAVTGGFPTLRRAIAAWRRTWNLSGAIPLLAFGGCLLIYYNFFFGAPHFIVRYLVPVRLAIALAMVSLLYLVWRLAERPAIRRFLMILMIACMGAACYGFTWNINGQSGNTFAVPALFIRDSLPPTSSIGMFQSGTTEFVNRNVINLDGKVNGAALNALLHGTISRYIDSLRLDYIIDWDFYTDQAFADSVTRSHYHPVDTLAEAFVIWKRKEE